MNSWLNRVKPWARRHPWLAGILALFLAYQAWQYVRLIPTPSERKTVQQLTQNMQTYCAGRYLVDLPADSKIVNAEYQVNHIQFSVMKTLSSPQLAQLVLSDEVIRYAKPYKEEMHAYIENTPLFISSLELGAGSQSFLRFEDVEGRDSRVIESFIPLQNHIVHVQVKSFVKYLDAEIQALKDFLPRLQILGERQVKGFCAGPVVAKDGTYKRETVEFSVVLPHNPDVILTFATDTYRDPEENGLLSRMNEVKGLMMRLVPGHRVLRSGSRKAGTIPGEEWLGWAQLENSAEHRFEWETSGKKADAKEPEIRFKLESGLQLQQEKTPAKPSLSDSEAIGLFEAIVDSIRLRPGAI